MTEAAISGPISRIEWVERELRRAILGGEFAPGERLLTVQLAEQYSVSPTPLREVLHRFAGEGLVEFIPQKGARVSELGLRDAAELAELRTILESANLRAAAEHLTPPDVDRVEQASRTLLASWHEGAGHSPAAEIAYRGFYSQAARTNPSTRLREQTSLTRELGARYRLAAAPELTVDDLSGWHLRVWEAFRSGRANSIGAAIAAETDGLAAAFGRFQGGGRNG